MDPSLLDSENANTDALLGKLLLESVSCRVTVLESNRTLRTVCLFTRNRCVFLVSWREFSDARLRIWRKKITVKFRNIPLVKCGQVPTSLPSLFFCFFCWGTNFFVLKTMSLVVGLGGCAWKKKKRKKWWNGNVWVRSRDGVGGLGDYSLTWIDWKGWQMGAVTRFLCWPF